MSDTEKMKSMFLRLVAANEVLKSFVVCMFRVCPDRQLVLEYFKELGSQVNDESLFSDFPEELLEYVYCEQKKLIDLASLVGFRP